MDKARKLLQEFATERRLERIGDDLPALDSHLATSEQLTDCYLADLATD